MKLLQFSFIIDSVWRSFFAFQLIPRLLFNRDVSPVRLFLYQRWQSPVSMCAHMCVCLCSQLGEVTQKCHHKKIQEVILALFNCTDVHPHVTHLPKKIKATWLHLCAAARCECQQGGGWFIENPLKEMVQQTYSVFFQTLNEISSESVFFSCTAARFLSERLR